MYRIVILMLTFLTASCVFAQGSAPLPLTHVTLYTSGVGYFERTGTVVGDNVSTMYFPLEQVNDVLKSLVLLDYDGGTIEPVTYGAQDPVTKQLKAFSVDLSDDPDEATLLDRLRGADITITTTGGSAPLSGTIVGVETKTVQLPGQSSTDESSVNLMTFDSLVSCPLSTIASIQIDDPALRAEIKEALATVAEGRDASKRPVTISFSGAGSRKVLIGYLTQTPLWQTSYRLVLGKNPYLQGWALVQNTSQEDWSNVSLALVAGRPISFIQDLYTPVYVDRPVVQPQIIGSPTPQVYSSNLDIDNAETTSATDRQSFAQNRVAISGNDNVIVRSPALGAMPIAPNFEFRFSAQNEPPMSGSLPSLTATGAKLGSALFTFSIKVPVTIPRQQSAMIPFVGTDIQADRVSIYNQSVMSDHPLTSVRIKNTSGLHLMGGPITVFDDNSAGGSAYVGDALIDDTEVGESKLLSFAVDLAVDASCDPGPQLSTVTEVTLSKGVLHSKTVTRTTTDYTFKNNSDTDRTIIVEHPYTDDRMQILKPATYSEKTADVYRFELQVKPHDNGSLQVVQEVPDFESYELTDLQAGDFAVYIEGDGVSQAVKDALAHITLLRGSVSDTQNKISENEAEDTSISLDQNRIRNNMAVLSKTDTLYRRYADELSAQETQLESLSSEHDVLEGELAQQQDALSDYIQGLSVN